MSREKIDVPSLLESMNSFTSIFSLLTKEESAHETA